MCVGGGRSLLDAKKRLSGLNLKPYTGMTRLDRKQTGPVGIQDACVHMALARGS